MSKVMKKYLSFVVALVMLFSVLTQAAGVASAEETPVLTFTVKNGKATVSKVDSNATVVEIPAEYDGVPVTAVGQNVFVACYNITEFVVDENSGYFSTDENGVLFNKDKTELVRFPVASDVTEYDIPESVTDLGHYAFFHATKLQRVSIPGSIDCIGVTDFYDCNSLQKIEFSEGLTRISEQAFAFCKALTNIELPDSLKYIDMAAFIGCNLTGVLELPESLRPINSDLIWSEVFGGPITEYSVPASNDYLSADENGFLFNKDKTVLLSAPRASAVTEYQVPESVTEIATGAFAYVTALSAVNCHNGISKIGEAAFRNSGITSFSAPAFVTEIPEQAFDSCDNLSAVVLTDSIASIGADAFWSCDSLNSIEIPDSVNNIGERAFRYSGLESIILPSAITEIKTYTFGNCDNLTDVYFKGTEDEWNNIAIAEGNEYLVDATVHYNYGKTEGDLGENLMWDFNKDTNALSVYGSGAMVSYGTFEEYPWSAYKDKIEYVYLANGVASVGDNAFNGCAALEEVFLGNTVEKVGQNAFSDCHSLAVVTACAEKLTAENNSFGGNDDRLVLIYNAESSQVKAFAEENDISTISASYDSSKNVLGFNGEFIIYSDLDYNMLAKLIQYHPDTKYLFFEKLVFDGITSGVFNLEGFENVETEEEYLTFRNLYISISAVRDGGEENITFAQFIDMLESGDHEGFLVEIESDGEKESVDFMRTIEHFVTNALKMVSKLINLISKIFKKK